MSNSTFTMKEPIFTMTPSAETFSVTQDKTFTVTTDSCKLYKFIMSVGLIGSFCIFGIVGNILTLVIFSKFNRHNKKTRSSATLLLSSLAVSDILLLFTLFIMKTIPAFISFTNIDVNFFCVIHLCFSYGVSLTLCGCCTVN